MYQKEDNTSQSGKSAKSNTADNVSHISIIGGGTAGWLTACILKTHKNTKNLRVTVFESDSIPTIGVGEATYVSIVETMSSIGVSEKEFMDACDATFKQSILFRGWSNRDFHHPFQPHSIVDASRTTFDVWLDGGMSEPFDQCMSGQPASCYEGLTPKSRYWNSEYTSRFHYAYHIDASKLGCFLREHAKNKLGVRHHFDDFVSVNRGGSISFASGQKYHCDLIIDCTGFSRRVIGHDSFIERSSGSMINCALAGNAPISGGEGSYTTSTAFEEGWIWDIPLRNRRGVGVCFNDSTDAESAQRNLFDYLGQEIETKKICFNPGNLGSPWSGICVAIGNSNGFVEPLESTAIGMIEASAKTLCDVMPKHKSEIVGASYVFNRVCNERWSSIYDFIDMHYLLSHRSFDHEFWYAAGCNIIKGSPDLCGQIQLFNRYPISRNLLERPNDIFKVENWRYIYYGMQSGDNMHYYNDSSPDESRITIKSNKINALNHCLGYDEFFEKSS